ncbi:MAG: SMC family ATPase, partial [Actinobacteria bacterium]|nr:SMC family ATPase [Actinomycetota bacterium]
MRLLRLRLQDFRSYRQADIDFSSVRLASVVGSNGAGKSSLLEATIFALTGARGIRNLDAFVRQGCEECRVALVFRAAGETFRVTRTRSTRGSGKSTVELARQDTGGLWVAEGAGARDTEERIRQILGVDEETLLGTAIVSQGDAGSFFALRPAQRLEALGSILRLNERFGPLEAHFRARAAEARADLEAARRDMERLEQDVEALAAKEAARLQAEEQLDQARAAVARAEKELDQAQHAASLTQAAVGSLGLARA